MQGDIYFSCIQRKFFSVSENSIVECQSYMYRKIYFCLCLMGGRGVEVMQIHSFYHQGNFFVLKYCLLQVFVNLSHVPLTPNL